MRILVLTFYYEPDLSAGSFRTTAFVNSLKKYLQNDDKLEVITTQPNRYESFKQEANSKEKVGNNIEINRINLGTHKSGFVDQSKLFVKFALETFKIIRKKEKYDIVYATSSRLMTAFLGALIANRQKSKLYLDIRDIFTDTLKSIFVDSKLRFFVPVFSYIEKYTINSATHVNLVSEGFRGHFDKINNKIKYSFFTNGIDDIFLNYDFTNQISDKKTVITYAGNIGEGQGLEKIIPNMAIKLGNEYQINIIGDGGRKKILTEKLIDINNVKLYNPVTREKLLEMYKDSDILFLHLNDYNAFKKVLPSKIFEYASTNKFIVAGVSGYARKFIEDNVNNSIVFEPCNIENFYKKFEKIEKIIDIERVEFCKKYNRKDIMIALAKEVYYL